MQKLLKWLTLGLIMLLSGLLAAFLWYRQASQPLINATLTLAGLAAPVDIVRDAEGIPHIYAQSEHDAWFALGFVHAQDRLWQMELNRRIPAGRMAEILGPSALGADRFLRTLGVRRNAEAILANLDPDTTAVLRAYASGVNAWLDNRSSPLPPEFLLTGAPAPEPWQAVDSIGWQTMMAWDLGANWTQELLRMRLAQRLPLAQINEFLPPYPGDPVLPTMDYTQLYRQLAETAEQLTRVARIAPPSYAEGMGSNSWVLSGALTETGKPLLANDPHLGLTAPGLWYFAHLSAPGLNTVGATLPGVPAVVLGRNDRIAWGFTNTAPDVQDLYLERINPDNPMQYQAPDGWRPFTIRTETIRVKGQADEVLEIRETRHGPVVTGALPIMERAALDASEYVVAFAWTALQPEDRTFQAILRMNHAGNWRQFLDAARDFGAPQQNILYADVEGNIGFVAPGLVPIRKPENDLHGLAPSPGWDERYDWTGFIPFEELPRQYNPATQRMISANEKMVGPDYPHFITSEWVLPYRANRIRALLDAQPLHSMTSFAEIQKDHLSLAAQELLPLLRLTEPKSPRARQALSMLQQWDGAMHAEKAEPLLFNAWVREASRLIFADELGEELMNDYWELRNVQQPMVNVLKNVDGQQRWCGNAAAGCGALLSEALENALADLEQRYGSDMQRWQWGTAHAARFEHRPFGRNGWLARLFDVRVPTPGDTYTINVGRHNLRDEAEPFTSRHAVSLRALYDLSDLENSRFIHASGQSGNVLSPLYDNYVQRWAKVAYLPMRTQRKSVDQGSIGMLRLEPVSAGTSGNQQDANQTQNLPTL